MGYEKRARTEEKALVQRMLAGDEQAMEEFADGYFPSLLLFARARLRGDSDLARDIVQTTVCKALTKLRSYRGEAPLFTWLCACCHNEMRMHFRRKQRFPELELDEEAAALATAASAANVPGARAVETPEQEAERRESAQLVHLTLDLLPPRYARALEWKYLESLPVNEIAGRLRVRPKAAESLLTRARNAFRDAHDLLTRHPQARRRALAGTMLSEADSTKADETERTADHGQAASIHG